MRSDSEATATPMQLMRIPSAVKGAYETLWNGMAIPSENVQSQNVYSPSNRKRKVGVYKYLEKMAFSKSPMRAAAVASPKMTSPP